MQKLQQQVLLQCLDSYWQHIPEMLLITNQLSLIFLLDSVWAAIPYNQINVSVRKVHVDAHRDKTLDNR